MKLGMIAAGTLLVCATVAAADPYLDGPPLGSRLGSRVEREQVASEKESALTAQSFAVCLVGRKEREVHDFLSADEKLSDKAGKRLMGEVDCLSMDRPRHHLVEGFAVRFPTDVLRGMLAEQWLKNSGSAASSLQPLPLQRVYQRPWFATTGRDPVVDEMGACIADVNPAGLLSVLAAQPYSGAERTAFAGLNATMASCLRAGAKLQANRQALRAALAEGLYQRLRAPAPAPTASVAQTAK